MTAELRRLWVKQAQVMDYGGQKRWLFSVDEKTMDEFCEEESFFFKKHETPLSGWLQPGNSVIFESQSKMAFYEVSVSDYSAPKDGILRLRSCAKTSKMPACPPRWRW